MPGNPTDIRSKLHRKNRMTEKLEDSKDKRSNRSKFRNSGLKVEMQFLPTQDLS